MPTIVLPNRRKYQPTRKWRRTIASFLQTTRIRYSPTQNSHSLGHHMLLESQGKLSYHWVCSRYSIHRRRSLDSTVDLYNINENSINTIPSVCKPSNGNHAEVTCVSWNVCNLQLLFTEFRAMVRLLFLALQTVRSACGTRKVCPSSSFSSLGKELSAIQPFQNHVFNARFSPDDQELLVCGLDPSIYLYDIKDPTNPVLVCLIGRSWSSRKSQARNSTTITPPAWCCLTPPSCWTVIGWIPTPIPSLTMMVRCSLLLGTFFFILFIA